MKSFTTIPFALLSLIAAVHAASSSSSAPYPSSTPKGVGQIADGQIQATGGAAKPTISGVAKATASAGVAKPSTAPSSKNSTVPFTGAGNQMAAAPVGGLMVALAAAVVVL